MVMAICTPIGLLPPFPLLLRGPRPGAPISQGPIMISAAFVCVPVVGMHPFSSPPPSPLLFARTSPRREAGAGQTTTAGGGVMRSIHGEWMTPFVFCPAGSGAVSAPRSLLDGILTDSYGRPSRHFSGPPFFLFFPPLHRIPP